MASGFIHCCTGEQLTGVVTRYFSGDKSALLVLSLDLERLTHPIKWEKATDSDGLFPHVYGHINRSAIAAVVPYSDFNRY